MLLGHYVISQTKCSNFIFISEIGMTKPISSTKEKVNFYRGLPLITGVGGSTPMHTNAYKGDCDQNTIKIPILYAGVLKMLHWL